MNTTAETKAPPVPLRLVAPYLRAGDRVLCSGEELTLKGQCEAGSWWPVEPNQYGAHNIGPVSLITPISPRLVPVAIGEMIKAGEPYAACCDGQWSDFAPNSHDEKAYAGAFFRLVRDEAPETIIVTRDNLSVGDVVEFVALCDNDGANAVAGINRNAPYRVACFSCKLSGWYGVPAQGNEIRIALGDTVRIISRAQPAPAETLPREIPRSELRVGDKYRSYAGTFLVVADSYDGNAERWAILEMIDGARVEPCGKKAPGLVTLLSRNNPVDPPVAVPSPAPEPDHSALREAWRFLAERTPWRTMAERGLIRGGLAPDALTESVLNVSITILRVTAGSVFEEALKNERGCARGEQCLVVITGSEVEYYSPYLNDAAYHARREELWPTTPLKLCACGAALMGKQVTMCGDCGQSAHRRVLNSVFQCDTSRHDNRFRGITDTTPARPLSPGVAYHLQDDPDATGLPSHD